MNFIENFNNHAISSNKMKNIVLKYNILFFIKHYKACLMFDGNLINVRIM